MKLKSCDKLLIIGDVHGLVGGYYDLLEEKVVSSNETVKSIQLGDFGFEKEYKKRNQIFEKSSSLNKKDHLFFGGNHDDYNSLPEFHIGNFGELPFIENSYFVRGAESIDKAKRTPGHDWWPEEELNWRQARMCAADYEEKNPSVVITHDAPGNVCKKIFPDKKINSSATIKLLQALYDASPPDLWVFGHWHEDKVKKVDQTIFVCLDELSTFEFESDRSLKADIKAHVEKLQ